MLTLVQDKNQDPMFPIVLVQFPLPVPVPCSVNKPLLRVTSAVLCARLQPEMIYKLLLNFGLFIHIAKNLILFLSVVGFLHWGGGGCRVLLNVSPVQVYGTSVTYIQNVLNSCRKNFSIVRKQTISPTQWSKF